MNVTSGREFFSFFLEPHYVALGITSASLSNILGLPLNSYVMWLILAGARENLTTDFFSLNLAISEIFFSLSTIWYFVFIQFNSIFCFDAYMFARGLFYTARPLFQCYICFECYVGVVHPVLFLHFKPLRYKVACCCVAWPIVLVSCIYCWSTYSKPLYLYAFLIQNLLFFSMMLFCCLSVLWALKRPGPGDKATERKKSNALKRKAFKKILLIVICVVTNFFLYVAPIPLQCCLKCEFAIVLSICTSLALTTGFIQPLFYLYRTGRLICLREN